MHPQNATPGVSDPHGGRVRADGDGRDRREERGKETALRGQQVRARARAGDDQRDEGAGGALPEQDELRSPEGDEKRTRGDATGSGGVGGLRVL
eukprot:3013987-Rhodomonas_salina.1